MKIAFLVRYDFFDKFGGDTNQVEKYKKYWLNQGEDVDIITTKDFKRNYDVYIVVNIDRFLETFFYLRVLKKYNLLNKTFLLTIHHSYKDIEYFEINSRKGLNGFLTKMFGFFGREKVKGLIFGLKNKNYLFPALIQLFISEVNFLSELNNSIVFIFIARGEKTIFEEDYGFKVKDYIFTKNGCDIETLDRRMKNSIDILISGRIEPRKNSLEIARVLSQLPDKKIVFVGGENNNSASYCNDFKKYISKFDNISYIGKVTSEEMKLLYMQSATHISCSWFEVSSLVDLEAYYYGCNIVSSSNGHTSEFLMDNAEYVDPKRVSSLPDKIESVMKKNVNIDSRVSYISENHSWSQNSNKLLTDINKYLDKRN